MKWLLLLPLSFYVSTFLRPGERLWRIMIRQRVFRARQAGPVALVRQWSVSGREKGLETRPRSTTEGVRLRWKKTVVANGASRQSSVVSFLNGLLGVRSARAVLWCHCHLCVLSECLVHSTAILFFFFSVCLFFLLISTISSFCPSSASP